MNVAPDDLPRSPLLEALIHLLRVERLEHNLFRGTSADIGSPSVFGGQVLGQALIAAARTVEGRLAHSLHAYFLRPGDMRAAIVYEVDRIRDGASFTTRRVSAIQHGRAIFTMAASFQVAEPGVEHQSTMPVVAAPEDLLNEAQLFALARERHPGLLDKWSGRARPIESRPLHPLDPLAPEPREAASGVWLRTVGALSDNDPVLHQALLAYASDFSLLRVAMHPHGMSFLQPRVQSVSLDHAMWFHREVRIDDWLLHAIDSPSAAAARGFCRGSIYSRDGRLVASVAQEGLLRLRSVP